MKPIKMMQAEHMYLIRGSSTANAAFFEKEADCKLFLELADRILGKFMSINSFQNNRDGWAMIITTKSADAIRKAYKARRKKSKTCKRKHAFKEVWRMLSDQVRILLSTYVKKTNHETGRTGSKVRRRYERFVFESEEEAKNMRDLLESEIYSQAQPVKAYRPKKHRHSIRKKLIKKSLYISSALLYAAKKLRKVGLGILDLGVFSLNVVREVIRATLDHHFPT